MTRKERILETISNSIILVKNLAEVSKDGKSCKNLLRDLVVAYNDIDDLLDKLEELSTMCTELGIAAKTDGPTSMDKPIKDMSTEELRKRVLSNEIEDIEQ